MVREPRQRFYILLGTFLILGLVFYAGISIGQRVTPEAKESSSPPQGVILDLEPEQSTSYHFYEDLEKPVPQRQVVRNPEIVERRQKALERKAKKNSKSDSNQSKQTTAKKAKNNLVSNKIVAESQPKTRPLDRAEQNSPEQNSPEQNSPEEEAVTPKSSPRKKTLPRTQKSYTLQVSAYRDQQEAFSMSSNLKQRGYSSFVISEEIPGQGKWYRVRIGKYGDLEDAQHAKSSFESKEGRRAFITEQ